MDEADFNYADMAAENSGAGHRESMNENPVVSVDLERFQVELEFVQCLANPFYLNYLAQHGYFDQSEFVNYIKYLLYWKQPEYAAFVKYPACLHMLELLQQEAFRRELVNPPCAKFIEEQLLLHWQFGSFRRQMAASGQAAAGTASVSTGAAPVASQPGTAAPAAGVTGSNFAPGGSGGAVSITASNNLAGQNSVLLSAQPAVNN